MDQSTHGRRRASPDRSVALELKYDDLATVESPSRVRIGYGRRAKPSADDRHAPRAKRAVKARSLRLEAIQQSARAGITED